VIEIFRVYREQDCDISSPSPLLQPAVPHRPVQKNGYIRDAGFAMPCLENEEPRSAFSKEEHATMPEAEGSPASMREPRGAAAVI